MAEKGWRHWLPRLAEFHAQVLKTSGGGGGNYLFKLHNGVRYGLTADLSLLGVSEQEAVSGEVLLLDLGHPEEEEDFEDEPDPDDAELDLFDSEIEGGSEDEEGEEATRPELAAKRDNAAAAARRIFLKQRGDPYNRETIVGFPLIGARVGRKKISGPLFYWGVEPQLEAAENRLTLTRPSLSPALNSMLLSKFTEDEAEIELVREQLVPVVQSEEFDLSSIDKAVRQLRSIFAPLEDLREVEFDGPALARFLEKISDLGGREPAVLTPVPVLVNSSRSFAFILEDLAELEGLEDPTEGSAVSGFVGELPEEVERADDRGLPFYDTMEGGDPLWFPMESNDAQRRVGRKARRVRTLTVQGPPGTGKTQTIANVVCDLVTEGKSVLVTSHTHKALEVLEDKLPPVDHLAVPVLSSDRESLTKLRSELEAVQEAGDRDPGELEAAVERAEEVLRDLDAELRHLDRRYAELRQIESKEYSEHVRLGDIREYDRIHPEDRPDHNQADTIASALKEYAGHLQDLQPALTHFRTFFRPNGDETSRVREAQRHHLLTNLLELYDTISDDLPELSLDFASRFVQEHGTSQAVEGHIQGWTNWLDESVYEIEEGLRWLGDRRAASPDMQELLRSARELGDPEELKEAWREHETFFRETEVTGQEVPRQFTTARRLELQAAIERLDEARESFFAWYLTPSAHRARRRLASAGFELSSRKEAGAQLRQVEAILDWQTNRMDCQELSETYDRLLPDGTVKPLEDAASTRALQRHARDRRRIFALMEGVLSSPLRQAPVSVLEELGDRLLHGIGNRPVDELKGVVEGAARRLSELRRADVLERTLSTASRWDEHKEQVLDAVERRTQGVVEDEKLAQLEALAEHYASFKRLVDLAETTLSDLGRTLDRSEEEIRKTGEIPEWVEKADVALEAHRLSSILRQSLSANPDDLTEIAERLAEGQDRRREIILRIIERRRELGVRKAVRAPVTNNALLNMRDLLGRKRMTKSFLSLRDQIEYRELLKLFPCWICNIDDVARLFPLEAGLFDYLIIDEASQCPQTALLPLAYRARRVIVVGDRKQLQPARARFLNQDNLAVMAQRAGVTEHPVAGAYDGKRSLLDVAERYREEFDFLDEHFRCDPAIIQWSNGRFYDHRLKILTHRRTAVFNPSLEVRELKDADEDGESKTNRQEAEAVIQELRRIVEDDELQRMKVGVISPYRKQADLLNEMIEREFADQPELKRRRELLASTADGFQGDERDIILYSFRYGPSSHPAVVHSIEREAERLNVAFTRAKRKVICFVSNPPSRFPKGLIRSFLEHAKQAERESDTAGRRPDHFDSKFEVEVCHALRDRGLKVTTQEPVAGFRIDLVVEDGQGRVLGVECDGEFKFNALGEMRPEDYQRQDVIERAGWTIHRISGRSWLTNPERETDRVVDVLESLPTAAEREVSTGPRVTTDEAATEAEPAQALESEELAIREEAEPSEDVVPREETVLNELGEDRQEQIVSVKLLWRWQITKGDLEGAALDALGEIEEELERGNSLSSSDLEFLEELLYSAYRQGFNPETAEELPEQPVPLSERRSKRAEVLVEETEAAEGAPPWEKGEHSDVEFRILDFLWDCRPEGRDKYEIAGHVKSQGDFLRSAVRPDRINQHLYGSLSQWVEKRGDRPPKWYVRDAP